MDTNSAIVALCALGVFAFCMWLVVTRKGDFEAGMRAGVREFFFKAKDRR